MAGRDYGRGLVLVTISRYLRGKRGGQGRGLGQELEKSRPASTHCHHLQPPRGLRTPSFKLQTPNPCFLCNHRNLTAPAPGCFEFRAARLGAKINRIAIPSPTKWAIRETDYSSDAIIIVIAIATSGGKGSNKGRAGPYRPRRLARGCWRGIGGSIHGRHRARCLPRGLQRQVCRHRSENTGREHISVRGCNHWRGATWPISASTYLPFGCSLTLMLITLCVSSLESSAASDGKVCGCYLLVHFSCS